MTKFGMFMYLLILNMGYIHRTNFLLHDEVYIAGIAKMSYSSPFPQFSPFKIHILSKDKQKRVGYHSDCLNHKNSRAKSRWCIIHNKLCSRPCLEAKRCPGLSAEGGRASVKQYLVSLLICSVNIHVED